MIPPKITTRRAAVGREPSLPPRPVEIPPRMPHVHRSAGRPGHTTSPHPTRPRCDLILVNRTNFTIFGSIPPLV
jgi:hypothetical protein